MPPCAMSIDKLSEQLDRRFPLLTDNSRTALPRHPTLSVETRDQSRKNSGDDCSGIELECNTGLVVVTVRRRAVTMAMR